MGRHERVAAAQYCDDQTYRRLARELGEAPGMAGSLLLRWFDDPATAAAAAAAAAAADTAVAVHPALSLRAAHRAWTAAALRRHAEADEAGDAAGRRAAARMVCGLRGLLGGTGGLLGPSGGGWMSTATASTAWMSTAQQHVSRYMA